MDLLARLFGGNSSVVTTVNDVEAEVRNAKVYAYVTLALLGYIAYRVSK